MPDPRLDLQALLICDYALTAQDGKISAIGLFSQINVMSLPAVHGRLFIVAVLETDPGVHELDLQVLAPSGRPILQNAPRLQMDVPEGASNANLVADLNGLELTELGPHRVELRRGDRLLGSAAFRVVMPWPAGPAGQA